MSFEIIGAAENSAVLIIVLIAILFSILIFVLIVGFIRWIFLVAQRLNALKKINTTLEFLLVETQKTNRSLNKISFEKPRPPELSPHQIYQIEKEIIHAARTAEPRKIKVACSHCGRLYSLPESAIGWTAKCKECLKIFTVQI